MEDRLIKKLYAGMKVAERLWWAGSMTECLNTLRGIVEYADMVEQEKQAHERKEVEAATKEYCEEVLSVKTKEVFKYHETDV
jgi:hypothetical protein